MQKPATVRIARWSATHPWSAMGLSSLASHVLPATSAISSVILLMGMAVGVDYSLFYLKREREERHKGKGHIDAIEIAAETSGRTVVVSGPP
ncbi:MMPL family transporter [Streptomyces sp. NPDC003860]